MITVRLPSSIEIIDCGPTRAAVAASADDPAIRYREVAVEYETGRVEIAGGI